MAAHSRRLQRGFTLLELLVTLAVAAILLGIAVPSYRSIVQRNAMVASVNDLVGDLNYARSEAVTRGQPVIVCQSDDQQNCTNDANAWHKGWIVYAPEPGTTAVTSGNRLRVKSNLDGQIEVTAGANINAAIAFDANGFSRTPGGAIGNGTFDVTAADTPESTKVVVSSSGRVRSESGAST